MRSPRESFGKAFGTAAAVEVAVVFVVVAVVCGAETAPLVVKVVCGGAVVVVAAGTGVSNSIASVVTTSEIFGVLSTLSAEATVAGITPVHSTNESKDAKIFFILISFSF